MSYLGSKAGTGVFQTIIGNMPEHSLYIEAFVGSGKILLTKKPAVRSIGIDADITAVNDFAMVSGFLMTSDPYKEYEESLAMLGNALDLIPEMTLPPGTLIYCDPPYLRETRTSRHGYAHEFDTPAQHTALLTLLQGLSCFVMVSGYPSKLYSHMLRDWRCVSYRTRTRGRTVTECLWCNFPEPTELHDWRYAGRNYRERLTLKRRVSRLTAKLEALAPRHRGFVPDAIQQRYFGRGRTATNVTIDFADPNVKSGAAVRNVRPGASQ